MNIYVNFSLQKKEDGMFNYFKQAAFALLLVFCGVFSSRAEIVLVNSDGNGFQNPSPFTQSAVDTPTGSAHDYQIIACATSSTGKNFFFDPVPDQFSVLSSDSCDTTNIGVGTCILGIWDRVADSPEASQDLCSWNDPTTVFAAASFRWKGVDIDDPIVELECETGFGAVATAPSVNAEDGSDVLRIFNFGVSFDQELVEATQIEADSVKVLVINQQGNELQATLLKALRFPDAAAGPTGTYTLNLPEEVGSPDAIAPWRACTITLRAAAVHIPALSEWGLGVFVALTGIASVWVLRRRAQRA
jgi:hypothetical protein